MVDKQIPNLKKEYTERGVEEQEEHRGQETEAKK